MMKKKEKISKSLKIAIITAFMLVMSILFINNVSWAYGVWQGDENGGMPQRGGTSPTGLMPQILKTRQFTGSADTQFPYTEWTTNISAGTVFCANSGTAVRFGKIDKEEHYLDEIGHGYENPDSWGYPAFEERMKRCLNDLAKESYNNLSGTTRNFSIDTSSYSISYVQFAGPQDYPERYEIRKNEAFIPMVRPGDEDAARYQWAMKLSGELVGKIFDGLGEWDKPTDNEDTSVNPDVPREDWNGDVEFGPEVCVMQTADNLEDGYKKVGSYTATNNRLAFILTAMENAYNTSIHTKYSLSDIQTAHWKEVDHDGISTHLTENGLKLFDQAIKYQEFVNTYASGASYTATIDTSQAQVIVNQETKNYIIGPLSISYPYYDDISYMKAMYIKTDEGTGNEKTLIYDESHDDFSIECTGEIKSGSNGLTKKYPAPNTQFYIKFSAEKTNYPKSVNIYSDFEYLKKTTINYNDLASHADIYQYIGYVTGDGEHQMRMAWGIGSVRYTYEKRHTRHWTDSNGKSHKSYYWTDESKTVRITESNCPEKGVLILQPMVQMSKYPVDNVRAQPQRVALNGSRTYSIYTTSGNGGPLDLTFELGGKVWVDGTAGKENAYDGIFNTATDTPMPNVKVSLYQVDDLNGNLNGKFIGAMTTDANGEYLFKEQNAMYQYYVKFTYNGQYYQPTIYNVNRDDPNWANTSKGLDILKDRDDFNARFEEIGSAKENTVGFTPASEMHTRQELQDAGLIDEFGNIPGGLDSNGDRKSSDAYVNYSMMDSYTCNGTSTKDLYPGFKVFVLDDYLNNLTNTQQVLTFIESKVVEILYGNPDYMHHINQGYVLRELVDLALRKDVYKATLEINGKTQVYKYNKREGLETDANGNSYWEIQTRISDGYYNYEYSRELYREDYDYKIDNYVMEGDPQTTLDNLGLTPDSELKIYVTYKYTIRNRSEGIAAKVTEIVDYYDKDYTFVPERSYLGDAGGNKIGEIKGTGSSKYNDSTETPISGYNNLYITGANGGELPLSDPDSNKDVYFYVTFIVNKDGNRNNILDENVANAAPDGVGKENIAEINGYKSYYGTKAHAPNTGNSQTQQEYATGDIAGIADTNSTPGNLNPNDVPKDGKINYDNFENDTDKAPNIRIILNRDNLRTVEGTVWEDSRTEDEQFAKVGNGLRDSETGINGVRVQLVEIRDGKDGNKYEYIWKEVYSGNMDSISPIINNSGIIENYTIDTSNANGKYKFASFAPGNYIIRFIYGSGESSVLGTTYTNYNTGDEAPNPVTDLYDSDVSGYKKRAGDNGYSATNENIGLNKNSYNGQDYKSTSYQVGIDNGTGAYENNSTTSYTYNFSAADGGLYSDAKDIMNKKSDNVINIAPKAEYLVDCANSRKQVEEYSNGDEINSKAEILSSYEHIPEYNYTKYTATEMKNLLDQFMKNTYMISESGTIDVNFEYNRTGAEDNYTNTSNSGHDNIGSSNYEMCGYYVLKDLDLGLEQRPKAQLKVTKQITNVKLTLANGSVLFDASNKATNVLWIPHTAHGQDTRNTYKTSNNYDNSMMKNPIVRQQSTNKGKVQLTMDEELMHGSTIQITYAITVANVGEVDYNENKFYYTGKVGDASTIVKTDPRMLVDYVGTQVHDYTSNDDKTATRNNLQFNQQQNPNWSVISSTELLNRGLLNNKLQANVEKYTDGHIVITDKASKGLIPIIADQAKVENTIKNAFNDDPLHALEVVNDTNSVSGVQLILSQMITQDSDSDDRIYNNMTEIVTTKNDVGRRMSYSVVGNQDPTIEPQEIDADDSQEVVILPPFGQQYIYYILGTAVAVILIAGIIITIVVLKKRK